MSCFESRAGAPASTLGLLGFFLASASLLACGGRSELDDYADGVPGIVPQPNGAGGNQGDGDGDGNGDGDGMSAAGAEVGEACQMASDCMGGANATCLQMLQITVIAFPLTINFPGGFCTIRNCTSDNDCPTGSACLSGFSEPACTPLCTDNSQCRADEGYTCNTIMSFTGTSDPRKFCQPPFELPGIPGGGGNLFGGGGFPGGGG